MLTNTDRIVIATGDLEKAQKDLVHVLGRSPSWVGGYPGDETESVLWKLDNICIELVAPVGDTQACKALRERLDSSGGGVHALHLACDDIETTTAALREAGLHPSVPVEGMTKDEPSGAYRRFLHCDLPPEDCAGVRLHLVEHQSEPDELPPSLPLEGDAAAATGGDHVVIFTTAPERAIDLYSSKLGIRLALDKTFPERQTRLLFFRLGGFTIEMGGSLKEIGKEPVADDRFWGIAYRVDDLEAVSDRIQRAGLDVTGIRDGNKPGTRVFTVKHEPAGVPTLIIQHE